LTPFGRRCVDQLAARVAPVDSLVLIPVRIDTGQILIEGWGYSEEQVRDAIVEHLILVEGQQSAAALRVAAKATLTQVWFSESGGFGHDCAAHEGEAPGPHCGSFRQVICVDGVPS
jgi:hypothetical protein